MEKAASRLLGIAPYFLVRDVVKAAEYYRDVLGFTVRRYFGYLIAFGSTAR